MSVAWPNPRVIYRCPLCRRIMQHLRNGPDHLFKCAVGCPAGDNPGPTPEDAIHNHQLAIGDRLSRLGWCG